jgi:putative FmdB family regulatory protein
LALANGFNLRPVRAEIRIEQSSFDAANYFQNSQFHTHLLQLSSRWRFVMSTYVFFCQDCNKEFTKSLHMSEVEKVGVACPHCGSKRVLQAVAAFSAVTSKKS